LATCSETPRTVFSPKENSIISGRFQLLEEIGRGSMGQVWRARDTQHDASCAVKFMVDEYATHEDLRTRFLREARVAGRVQSPHAVQILSVGEWADTLFVAMELLVGETLRERLDRDVRLPLEDTAKLAAQIADVLDQAHVLGVVHRDLKPENLWLWEGSRPFVKVLDFGVAPPLDCGTVRTATGMLVGSPRYMSPEQASGSGELDQRADVWSLAMIVAECLAGRPVFDAPGLADLLMKIVSGPVPSLSEIGPDLPRSLEAWWTRAAAMDPQDRYDSAGELAEELSRRALAQRASHPRLHHLGIAPNAMSSENDRVRPDEQEPGETLEAPGEPTFEDSLISEPHIEGAEENGTDLVPAFSRSVKDRAADGAIEASAQPREGIARDDMDHGLEAAEARDAPAGRGSTVKPVVHAEAADASPGLGSTLVAFAAIGILGGIAAAAYLLLAEGGYSEAVVPASRPASPPQRSSAFISDVPPPQAAHSSEAAPTVRVPQPGTAAALPSGAPAPAGPAVKPVFAPGEDASSGGREASQLPAQTEPGR
jgi:serine/threonine protein kinase